MLVKDLIECLNQMSPNAIVKMQIEVGPTSGAAQITVDLDGVCSNGPIVTLLGEER